MIYTPTDAHHGAFDRAKFRNLSLAPLTPGNVYWHDQHDASTRNLPFDRFLTETHFKKLSEDSTSKILLFYGDEYYNLHDLTVWVETCKKWSIRPEQLYLFCLDSNWATWTTDTLKNLDFDGVNIQDLNLLMLRVQHQQQKPIEKRFSLLSRNYSNWRVTFYAELLKCGVLENSVYTFNNINPYEKTVFSKDKILKDLEESGVEKTEKLVNWVDGMPYSTKQDVQEKLAQEVYDIILSSGINVVIESHFDPFWTWHGHRGLDPRTFSPAFPTEKTYKAIACKRPFIMFTTPYFLQEFKKLGYKTFHPYIDESYDEIREDNLRLKALVKELERLNSLSDSDFANVLTGCQEIAEHNYKVMQDHQTNIIIKDNLKWVESYFARNNSGYGFLLKG